MRILIIDNNLDRDCWGADELRRFAVAMPGALVQVRRGPHSDLPRDLSGFDRLVVSGSRASALSEASWVSQLDECLRQALGSGKPVLGICYGHQMLARVLSGKDSVRQAAVPEFGWTKITQHRESRLLQGLPESFYSFSSHFQEVATLPPGARLLASAERCGIQAFQLEDRPVFGIQFHPERDLADGNHTIAEKREKGQADWLLNPDGGARLYDPKVGETIFRNFFLHE